jgi:hypothetical protein
MTTPIAANSPVRMAVSLAGASDCSRAPSNVTTLSTGCDRSMLRTAARTRSAMMAGSIAVRMKKRGSMIGTLAARPVRKADQPRTVLTCRSGRKTSSMGVSLS